MGAGVVSAMAAHGNTHWQVTMAAGAEREDVEDADVIPVAYTTLISVLDRKKIKGDLKAGIAVPGVSLKRSAPSLRVTVKA